MLEVAPKEEIKRIAQPLWLLINQSAWSDPEDPYDGIKCAALSIIANLAYCDINTEERKDPSRAKVVPSSIFQEIISGEDIDLVEIMRSLDFPDFTVLRTNRYVAVVVAVRDLILIGVRGTQFAYDWIINLKIYSRLGTRFNIDGRFHSGFLKDAEELSLLIEKYIHQRYGDSRLNGEKHLHFSGHSLGGAIAAILRHMRVQVAERNVWPSNLVSSNGCYVYGSPRIGSKRAMINIRQPYAIRRYLDIVPFCPPKLLGYREFSKQSLPDGSSYCRESGGELYFFGSWIFGLAIRKFLAEHSMEQYRRETIAAIVDHPKMRLIRALGNGLDTTDRARLKPGTVFRDVEAPWCPEMVVLPVGEFLMGWPENEEVRFSDEGPQHRVTIGYPFAIGGIRSRLVSTGASSRRRVTRTRVAYGFGMARRGRRRPRRTGAIPVSSRWTGILWWALGGRAGVHRLAGERDWKTLPAALGSGMGIRGARRDDNSLCIRRRDHP